MMVHQGSNSLRCSFILSAKSSGSSIVQRRLVDGGAAKVVPYTRHFENETLFWTKAASVLGLKQTKMPNSEVPISKPTAHRDLLLFMAQNAPDFDGNLVSEADMFSAWTQICRLHGPRLIETIETGTRAFTWPKSRPGYAGRILKVSTLILRSNTSLYG